MGVKGDGGSGGSGSKALLSSEEQFLLHNPNSSVRVNLTREEKRMKKIERLIKYGFNPSELKERYVIPARKVQLPPVGPLNDEALVEINKWARKRIDYLYLMVFGNGTKQVAGDMEAIKICIKDEIKPELDRIYAEIRVHEGVPVKPPPFFEIPLEEYTLPTPASKGKGKAKK